MIAKTKFLWSGILVSLAFTSCIKEFLPPDEEPEEEEMVDYTPPPQVYAPLYSINSGLHNNDIEVELYTLGDDHTIYFTLDGTVPTESSTEYTEPIIIAGDGTEEKIKAIAIRDDGEISSPTESYYRIDYEHDPSNKHTDLNIWEVKDLAIGTWAGHVTTPWVTDYNVDFNFMMSGEYTAHALTPSSHNANLNTEHWGPALYYGTDADSPEKTYSIFDMNADGTATANITVLFHVGTTNIDELRYISFSNEAKDYLEFELWHHGQYGPVTFKLARVGG